MNPTAIALALFAAVLHATWNALLRSGADRLWFMAAMSLATTAAALVCAVLLPLPPAVVWPYALLSALLQVGYSLMLVETYRHGELGQVYPVIRGAAPVLVALGGYLLADQRLGVRSLLGIMLVAGGILSLATGRGRAPAIGLALALGTGAVIAGYTTTDALAVARTDAALSYAVWMYLLYGLIMLATYILLRGPLRIDLRAADTRRALGGGLLSGLAYAAVLVAFMFAPAAPVAALRETSVVFAALIGWLFLGERLTWRRAAACAVVAAGAICLR